MYCSQSCLHKAQRRCTHPGKAKLRMLINTMPITKIAESFGVSDNAVRKWCRMYGIEMRPRGYWRRAECGKLDTPAVKEKRWRSRARKPEPERPKLVSKPGPRVIGHASRRCLSCGAMFASKSIGNRICPKCS